jgi:hypothetical protein
MPIVNRSIVLKSVEATAPDMQVFKEQPLSSMLQLIAKAAPKVAARHLPDPDDAIDGDRCYFLDNIGKSPTAQTATVFRFCSYRKGHLPLGLAPDFSQASVDVAAARLVDKKTNAKREPVFSLFGLAFGHVVVMESVRGVGGVGALENCLWELVKKFVDSSYPRIHLVDVHSRETAAAISRGGGVKEVVLDALAPHEDAANVFGELLNTARKRIGGTDFVRLLYRANRDRTLKREDVLKAYKDYDADEVDRITLLLKDGSTIIGLDKCRMRKQLKLDANTVGEINSGDLILEMAQFLLELRKKHDGVSVITADGRLG